MKEYQRYMDRQQVGGDLHRRLLELERPKKQVHWARWGALAACCVLIVGAAVSYAVREAKREAEWNALQAGFEPAISREELPPSSENTPTYAEDVSPVQPSERGFVVSAPEDAGKRPFPAVPTIVYQTVACCSPEMGALRQYESGTFRVNLEKEDIQTIFWGPAGKPETEHFKMEEGDLPWALFWDGYTVSGYAWYDKQGQLIELTIYGELGRDGFTLKLCPGALPYSFLGGSNRETSEVQGVEVTGWSGAFEWDGDGLTDYLCGSEFMLGDVGVMFENQNSPMQAEYGDSGDMELGGAQAFNALFVRQALTGGIYLDHLMTAESIPAWREAEFETLAQARQEAEFAPYLPAAEPEGYSAYVGNKEFYGHLSYQEGTQNTLWVRWSRGYDDVQVSVCRDGYYSCSLADPNHPASYDVRLYEIPWCDSVPEEYRETVDCPAFLIQDMSLAIVEARGLEKDTSGLSFRFDVMHPDGTVVCYRCDGMTAEQVWAMVEETLVEP